MTARVILLFLLLFPTAAVVAAPLIGFAPAFTNDASPFAVTECNAVCASPGTVTVDLMLVRSGDLTAITTVLVSTRSTSDTTASAATAGDDYTPLTNAPVVFQAGQHTKSVQVTVISDGVYEDDEFFEAVVTPQGLNTGVTVDPDAQVAYLKIVDGGDAGIFSFSASTYTFREDAGLVNVHIVRAGGASGNVTVTYRLANPGQATAINTKNFQLTDAIYELTFVENQRDATIPIRIINDAVYEAQEFFYLEISSLAPTKANDATQSVAKFGSTRMAVVFIADNGDAGQFDFASPYIFCREDNGSAVVSIVRSLGSSSSSYAPVTLSLTTVGTNGGSNATEGGSMAFDYQATSDKLVWADGETRRTFAVKVFNNKKYEPVTRAFKILMTAVDGGASIGPQAEIWVYIIDDRDAGTLSFKQAQYTVLENAGSITVDIVRTGLVDASGVNTYTSGIVSVDVLTFGGTILPGKQKYDDNYDNGVVQARHCTHISPCTAVAGVAYTPLASTTITFTDGENTKSVTIPILDDTLYEAPDQVFKVMLKNAVGGAHIGIDYEHPSEWLGYRAAFLELDKKRNDLPDSVGTIVTIQDDGDPAVLVSKMSLSVSEIGQTDRFDVWLNAKPQADVTVALQTDATALTLSVSTLTFTATNFATRQTVVVTAVGDHRTQTLPKTAISLTVTSADPLYNAPLRTSLAQTSGFTIGAKIYTQQPGVYDSGNALHAFPWLEQSGVLTSPLTKAELVAFTLDNDPAGIVLAPESDRHHSASTIVPENSVAIRVDGHKAVASVSLSSRPAGDVGISLVVVVGDGIKVSPATLTFTTADWNVAKQVEVSTVASAKPGINNGVYFTNVQIISTSSADPFYDQPTSSMATLFVERYPPAIVLFDASVLRIRENDTIGSVSYSVELGSEPMHWEPDGSREYNPFEVVLTATADTTLTLSADSTVAVAPMGSSATFSAAANASTSSTSTRLVRVGALRFTVNPTIAAATGSHQVGGATLRLYRVSGGENGGLGGIGVGVAIADGAMADTWDERWLRADCASDQNHAIDCSLRNDASSPAVPTTDLFPSAYDNLRSVTAGETVVRPTGTFDALANTYTPAAGWIDIDVTVALNAYLSKQHVLTESDEPFAHDMTFLVYTTAPSFFAYDGATDVTFASKDHSDASLRPQLRVLGSGRVNLARSGTASQSHAGNAEAAIDGQLASTLGVTSTFAMASASYKYPWWQVDLGAIRLIDEVVVTIKRRASAASLTATQLPVSVWLMLSATSLATGNTGISGFTAAKTNALFAQQFNVTGRSFTASESETIVLRWRVFGAAGDAAFGDDHFETDYTKTIEARYVLLQVDGDNNIALNEVQVFQPALASARVSLGGFMPSPSVVHNGHNQIGFQLDQPDAAANDCDVKTGVCRRELVFTSGDWWTPQSVGVAVVDDAVATGDRDILLTHTVQSAEAAFHGTSVCSGTTNPCRPALFNDSGVKILRVLDDDENAILFSTPTLEVEEGSSVSPNAPVVRREQRVFPASVRCSTDATKVLDSRDGRVAAPPTCANAYASTAPTWDACLTLPPTGSAWLMAGFVEHDINITEIVLTTPPRQGPAYVDRIHLSWTDTIDLTSQTSIDHATWTPISSYVVNVLPTGQQQLVASNLALASIQGLLVTFDRPTDDPKMRCIVAPSITLRARVAVPFPLSVRGDLTDANSVFPNESGRSRMHQVGRTATLGVRLASEPLADVTIAIVSDPDNEPVTVFDASSTSQELVHNDLVGGQYESGETVTFDAPTTLRFTPTNWNVSQTLTFLAVDDNVYNANRTFSISHVAMSSDATAAVLPHQVFTNGAIQHSSLTLSSDLAYAQAPYYVVTERLAAWPWNWAPSWISGRGTIDVLAIDDDLPGVTLSASVVTLSESALVPANYSVALDSAPTSDVVVTISYALDDSLLTVSPLRLTFSPTNWKVPQLVYITPVPNDVYDAGEPLTIGYDRLVAKATQPLLKHKVTSAHDDVYNGLAVGGNEPDQLVPYVQNQGVRAIIQDDDAGCPREYTCQNGGTCGNVTYGGRVGTSSASVCQCPGTYGMRDCHAGCLNEKTCAFSRIELVLQCRGGDPAAICGNVFSPARLVATLYRMLTTDQLTTSSGATFPPLALGSLADTLYLVNATTTPCLGSTASTCILVTMEVTKPKGSTNAIVDKIYGYLETGSLQTQPIFAERVTSQSPYPPSLGATVAVWIFVGVCVMGVGAVATFGTIRYVKLKRFHVQPDLRAEEAAAEAEPLTAHVKAR